MTRGEIVTVVLPGAHGKPRPAVIVQHDAFEALPSVTLLPLTSDVRDLPLMRISVPVGRESGIRVDSQVQVDKITTVPRTRVGKRVGELPEDVMRAVDEALGAFLGLA